MTRFRQRHRTLFGLLSAVLLAPPTHSWAETSPAVSAAIDAADAVTGHGFNLLLYLPVGMLAAAIALEWFAQWKANREVEPGILFLLFAGAGASVATALLALAFAKVGRGTGQLSSFCTWTGIVAGLISVAFFLKRKARDRKLFSLNPSPKLTGRVVNPRTANQKGLIVGYRLALATAFLAAMAGVSEMPVANVPLKSLAATVRTVTGATAPISAAAPDTSGAPRDSAAIIPESTPAAAPPIDAPRLADLIGKRDSAATAPADTSGLAAAAAASLEGRPSPREVAAAADSAPASQTTPPPEPPPSTPPPVTPDPTTPPPVAATSPPVPTPPPIPTPPPGSAATTPTVASPSAPALEKNFFAARIKPILESKCTSCHGSSKQKGDLRLDSIEAIKKGTGTPIVVAGNPESSSLYNRLTSPDDEEIMPPKEKGGPLPAAQIDLFRRWIAAGADFGDGAAPVALATTARPGGRMEEEISQKLPPPDAGLLSRLASAGVVIRPLSANGAVLELNFSHAESQIDLAQLAPIAKHIYALDLTRTKVRDEQISPLAAMSNLRRLQLNRNPITDAGLAHVKALANLEVLNLYETEVTDAGLDQLTGLKKLQKLFLFNTKCTAAGADRLKGQIPGVEVNLGV